MAFRVTQSMLSYNTLANVNKNLLQLQRYNEQSATQRRINRPSDDPVGINFAMRYRSDLRVAEQYAKNIDQANSWLEVTESLMNSVNDIMQRANQLAIQGANTGSNSDPSLESIAVEIDEMLEQLIGIGNERFRGKYVFNGENTGNPPYNAENIDESNVDTGKIRLEIGPGMTIDVNVNGHDVFGVVGDDDEDNLFKILSDLSGFLRDGDTDGINDVIGRLDERTNSFLETLASVGARANRLEIATERVKDDNYNLQRLISMTEDVDPVALITNLKMAENVYIASLSVSARILQPSLIDFLR